MKRTTVRKKSFSPSLKVVLTLVLVFLLILFLFPRILKLTVVRSLSQITGVSVRADWIDLSLKRPQFSMKGVRFSNPKNFPSADLAFLDEVKIHYRPTFWVPGQFAIEKVELNFREVRLVRNPEGDLSLPLLPEKKGSEKRIDELTLTLGPVTFTNLSGQHPIQQNFDLGLQGETYRNVEGVRGIMEIVDWELLKRTGLEEKREKKEEAPVVPAPADPSVPEAEVKDEPSDTVSE